MLDAIHLLMLVIEMLGSIKIMKFYDFFSKTTTPRAILDMTCLTYRRISSMRNRSSMNDKVEKENIDPAPKYFLTKMTYLSYSFGSL